MFNKSKIFLLICMLIVACLTSIWGQDPEYKYLNPFTGNLDATRSDTGIDGQWLRLDTTNSSGMNPYDTVLSGKTIHFNISSFEYWHIDTAGNFLPSSVNTWTERQPAGDVDKNWYIVASDDDGSNLIVSDSNETGRIYTSSDYGTNWTERQPKGDVDGRWIGVATDADGSNLIAGDNLERLYTSSDYGANWTERRPKGDVDGNWWSFSSDSDGSHLIASEFLGRLYTSDDYGATWTERQPAGDVDKGWSGTASSDDGSNLVVTSQPGRVYTSANYGVNWTERRPAGDVDKDWWGVASDSDGSNLIIPSSSFSTAGRLYTTDDYGATWTERQPAGNADQFWGGMGSDADGSHLVVCIYGGRVYTSGNYGITWTEQRPVGDVNKNWQWTATDADGSHLIACILPGRIYTTNVLTVPDIGSTTYGVKNIFVNNTATVNNAVINTTVIDSTITIPNTGLRILDTNASHDLVIKPGSDLSADRTLTLTTGDSDRTITLIGNPTLNDWFDQSVKTTASPTFAGLDITTDQKINFRDTEIGIYSQADTFLDIFADGAIRIGDSSAGAPTNYTNILPDGEINLVGTARVKRHIHLPLDNFLPGAQAPTATTIGHYSGYTYSQAVTQTATAVWHVPEDWDTTTDMVIHIHWAPTDATAGDVVWDIDYKSTASESNEIISGVQRSLSTTDSTQSLQYEHLQTADLIIPASDLAVLDMIGVCLSRDTGDVADTYGTGAFAFFLEIIYIANKLGESL